MIKLENVDFKYKGGKYIFKKLNLELQEKECTCIIGKNGSGKSTLARLIAGILKPTNGVISIDNNNTENKKNCMEIRKNVGIVFQNPENQIIFNNIQDDIEFALKNLQLDNRELRINQALEKVKMLDHKNEDTYELSLGQKQRVTIAGVLAINPKYIVFDEPTTMLDSEGKEEVYNIIKSLKDRGYTIIYVTNAIDEILFSDRIILLENNEICEDFRTNEIIDKIDILKKHKIKTPLIIDIVDFMQNKGININLKEFTLESLKEKLYQALNKKNEEK